MITESFLNSCYSVVLSPNELVKKNISLYRDIIEIIESIENKQKLEIPIPIKNKVECLKTICQMKMDGKTNGNVLDSITAFEKFKYLTDYINEKINESLTEDVISDNVNQIRLRKKFSFLLKNYDKVSSFLDTFKEGSFNSIDEFTSEYETVVKEMYTSLSESNRSLSIEATKSLDLMRDDFESVLKTIIQKYDRVNTTETGFPVLDSEVLNGGFEASRLYVFAGSSSSGKSTILTNFITNAATMVGTFNLSGLNVKSNGDDIQKIFVLITLENTIEESLMRIYMSMFDKTTNQFISDVKNGIDIRKKIINELLKSKSTIIMKYFPAETISSIDIGCVLDEVISEYGSNKIKGLYVDYLDLLRADVKNDQYRLELGSITLGLKTVAIEYNIPVITATQLGRSAYRTEDSRSLGVDQVSESIKKVEHADFIAVMARDVSSEEIVHCKIGKNRSGRANVPIEWKVNFKCYKFIAGSLLSNEKKPDSTTKSNEWVDVNKSFKGCFV